MTEKTTLKEVIDKSFDKKDINEVYKLISENGFSATDLKVYYKKNSKSSSNPNVFKIKEFWNSKLPLLHLNDILKTDLKNSFLDHYFKKNKFCNHQLNQVLVSSCLSDFLVFFKMNKAFRYDDFMNSLADIVKSGKADTKLKIFHKEILEIQKASLNIKKKQDEIREQLAKNKLDYLLLGFTLWYQNLKVSPSVLDNKSNQTKHEMAAAEELNEVLKLYKNKKQKNISINSNSELQNLFDTNKSPHPILDKSKKTNAKVEVLQNISDLIDEAIKTTVFNYYIDLYLCGYAEIELIDNEEIELKTNKHFIRFNYNDIKTGVEEMYFLSKHKNNPQNYMINLEITEFYGFPSKFEWNNSSIDLEKIFKFLTDFSKFKGPEERKIAIIGDTPKVLKVYNKAPDLFAKYFDSNESITLFDYKELLSGIQEFFKWEKTEVENILNFLTFDLSAKDYPKNWMSFPFLRIDNKIIWLGSFLRDRRWENILINKIKLEKGFEKLRQIAASNFEIRMEELFRGKGFKTNRGYGFKNCDGESGEIDLIAYKDNYLFICEAKSSIRSDDFSHSVETQNRIFEGKAAHQLIKCDTNIIEKWDNIKSKLNIDKDLQIQDIKIIPLIVTDHFEGDSALYLGKYQKVSFLELDVIMNNTKKELLEKYLHHEKRNNPKKFDLWYGHDELKLEFIEQNIKDNSVWKGLEQLIDTNYRELTIPMMMD